jgi:hypothetical protein
LYRVQGVGFYDSDSRWLRWKLAFVVGSRGVELLVDVDVDVEVEVDCAKAWEMSEYRMSSVFLSPLRAKGWDFRMAGIVVLIVSFASLARAALLSQGRMSALEKDAMVLDLSSGEFVV